ncbi:MAG: holo-ACP synthase [Propionicimonas sp.]|uniref:holo-ACP synthase n=1 Tax=Propionicimonas sp. TaxID=1955623 RepID=UPI003D13E00D
MILGLGIDVTQVSRFSEAAERTPGLLDKIFTPGEHDTSMQRMAGRFAAKEAFAKALGAPTGLVWTDVEVRKDAEGKPYFSCSGTVAALVAERGIASIHLSITHDAGIAAAVVVCES